MFNNYFTLYKLIREFKDILKEKNLIDAFSQEKNRLILCFASSYNSTSYRDDDVYVEICVNPNKPYILIRRKYNRARKNSITFFTDYLTSNLKLIKIADFERIIEFNFGGFSIYAIFRGPASNVVLIKDGLILQMFKQSDNVAIEQVKLAIQNASFSEQLYNLELPETQPLNIESLKRLFPFFSPKMIKEIRIRVTELDNGFSNLNINSLIAEVLNSEFILCEDVKSKELLLIPETFTYDQSQLLVRKNTLNDLIHEYLRREAVNKHFSSIFSLTSKFLEKNLLQSSNKINQLKNRIEQKSKEDEFSHYAQLLFININSVRPLTDSVELEDVFNDNILITIPLKKMLSPKANAEYYFEKAKEEKVRYKKSLLLYKEEEEKFFKLKQFEIRLKNIQSLEELNEIAKELGVGSKSDDNKEDDLTLKFRKFTINGKYNVYVGKDSQSNDLLTMRFAKQNDLWFHARGYAGSHVVLRVDNSKEGIPKEIIKKAAAIAAFYSKGKTSKLVPVSYTFKKYVTKKKGMNPGQVALMREEVVMVKPGIEEEN